ncbi:MAG: LCP family protein [Capsulimonadaceae bacterium]
MGQSPRVPRKRPTEPRRARAAGATAAPPPRRARATPPRSGPPSGAIAAVVVVLGILGFCAGYLWRSPALRKLLPAMLDMHRTPAAVFPGGTRLNLLVIVGTGDEHSLRSQVDLLAEAHLDLGAAGGAATVVSIPCDTRVLVPGHGFGTISTAYTLHGPVLTEATIESNFAIPSDKYIALDRAGFERAVDLLGGIDVNIDRQVDTVDPVAASPVHLDVGLEHLTGREAAAFLTYRQIGEGEPIREHRLRSLLDGLAARLHDPKAVLMLPMILDVVDSHVESDLTSEQEVALARLVPSIPLSRATLETLPTRGAPETVLSTDWKDATPMIEHAFGVTPPAVSDRPVARRPRHRRRAARR